MIKRPQKPPSVSITNEHLENLMFPILGSPKLDGYRCVTQDGAFTSSMKKITNRFIQDTLSASAYNGLDGELIVGRPNTLSTFNNTTGPVRRFDGAPDFKFFVFDLHSEPSLKYKHRHEKLLDYKGLPHIHIVKQAVLNSVEEVLRYERLCVTNGFEGAIVRSMHGYYKPGRCTLREQNIFKRKPVEDDEAIIIGFEEQQQNLNEATVSETGNMVRSSHKDNKVGKGTLGKFILISDKWGGPFAIGTGQGLTDALRQEIWDNQGKYLNKVITYKYQLYGSIDAPRQPIFKGFRDLADLTDF